MGRTNHPVISVGVSSDAILLPPSVLHPRSFPHVDDMNVNNRPPRDCTCHRSPTSVAVTEKHDVSVPTFVPSNVVSTALDPSVKMDLGVIWSLMDTMPCWSTPIILKVPSVIHDLACTRTTAFGALMNCGGTGMGGCVMGAMVIGMGEGVGAIVGTGSAGPLGHAWSSRPYVL